MIFLLLILRNIPILIVGGIIRMQQSFGELALTRIEINRKRGMSFTNRYFFIIIFFIISRYPFSIYLHILVIYLGESCLSTFSICRWVFGNRKCRQTESPLFILSLLMFIFSFPYNFVFIIVLMKSLLRLLK